MVRTLHHPQAAYIAPHFARFELAAGDSLIVRSPDGKQVWRYDGLGRAGLGMTSGGFWSGHIKGDTAIVELFASRPAPSASSSIASLEGSAGRDRGAIPGIKPGFDPDLPGPDAICGADDSEWAQCSRRASPRSTTSRARSPGC